MLYTSLERKDIMKIHVQFKQKCKIYIFDLELFLYTRNLSNECSNPVFEYNIAF